MYVVRFRRGVPSSPCTHERHQVKGINGSIRAIDQSDGSITCCRNSRRINYAQHMEAGDAGEKPCITVTVDSRPQTRDKYVRNLGCNTCCPPMMLVSAWGWTTLFRGKEVWTRRSRSGVMGLRVLVYRTTITHSRRLGRQEQVGEILHLL